MEAAMMRYDEADAENRALRAAKYELEAKASGMPLAQQVLFSVCGIC